MVEQQHRRYVVYWRYPPRPCPIAYFKEVRAASGDDAVRAFKEWWLAEYSRHYGADDYANVGIERVILQTE